MKRKVSLLNAGKVFLAVVLMNIAIQFLASVILLLADIENGTPEFNAFNYIFMLVLQMGNAVVLLLFFKKGFCKVIHADTLTTSPSLVVFNSPTPTIPSFTS